MVASGQADSAQSVLDRRFVLVAEHKRGGMGTVWRARDLETNRPVAVKILHLTSAEPFERFAREGKLLADLSHPGIVSYVGHGITSAGVPYLAMEWLEGATVAEHLVREPLTLRESLTLIRAATRGLAVAHGRGLVHRDLKPSNLFLRGGDIEDVVLLDLGIARYAEGGNELTRSGSILGTPSYMAPEQAQGHLGIGPAVDVFSLGCVLFECLTGEPPFMGTHVFSVLAKVLFEDAPRLRALRPEIPEPVAALVARMLDKDPARRMADAAALQAALAALGDQADVPAPRTSLPPVCTPSAEQELVSVILVNASADGRLEAELPDVSVYGAELKRLADGAAVVTLAQRGGAATDLATRAGRCALRLRDAAPAAIIVVATGRGIARASSDALLAPAGGQDGDVGGGYIGEAVDRGASMLRARDGQAGGTVWLDEVTAGLLDARFRVSREPDGPALLEGEDPSVDPSRRLLGRPTTCVGREHELALLELTLRTCVEDASPRAMLVVGPAGMGKSRLRHELLRRVASHDASITLLVGQGDPFRVSSKRGLLGDALSRLCGVSAAASEAEHRAALEARVGRGGNASPRRTTIFLAELCGLLPDALEESPELHAARQDPRVMADLLGQAWVTFLRAEAAVRPVLLVLDDLQWSDALTIALVERTLRELGEAPFMVLGLARPEVLELFPDLWAPRLVTVPLQPLAGAAAARLIRQALGAAVSDATVARMVTRAAGNALYVEELIRAADARRDDVPDTVLAMLQARIGLLAPSLRRVLRAASVFGESFPVAGVQALLGAARVEEQVHPGLLALARHEIVEPQEGDRVSNGGVGAGAGHRWRFHHALMRDAAYGLLTVEDRRASHGLAARFLETAGEDSAVIAAHYEQGAERASALRHYAAAAQQAFGRNDLAAVIVLVDRGISCGAAGEERGVLRSIEAPARFYQNAFEASWTASGEALALLPAGHPKRSESLSARLYAGLHLGRTDELERQVEELLAEQPSADRPADYAYALGWAFISLAAKGERAAAVRLLDRISAVGAQLGETDALVDGQVLYWRMRFEELLGDDPYAAWSQAAGGVRSYQRSGDRRMLAYMQAELGECTRRLFSVEEGTAIMRQAVELARELREPVTTAFVEQYLSTLLAEHGATEDLAEARELTRSILVLTGPETAYHAFGQISLALVELREGDLGAAERQARAARATIQSLGLRGYFPHADTALLRVLVRAGDGAAAAALADEALAALERVGPMGLLETPLRLAAARAHFLAGRRDDASSGVTAALAQLARREAAIPDSLVRDLFATEVPEHASLRELGRELGTTIEHAQTTE